MTDPGGTHLNFAALSRGPRRALTLMFCSAISTTLLNAQYPPPTDAYVANTSVNTVTVIDTATATVRGTVPVSAGPSRIAVSPDGARAYVSHPSLALVSVIDAATRTVAGTITTAAGPGALAVSPGGQRLFVAIPGAVQIIDLGYAYGTSIATVTTAGTAAEILFTPNGDRAYLAAGLLSYIDTATNTASSTPIPATSIAISPNGQKLYAASSTGVSEIDTAANTVTRSIGLGGTAGPLALTPDGSRLYSGVQGFTLVSSTYGTFSVAFRNVTVVDAYAFSSIATISVSAPVTRMAVTPNRADLYMLIPTSRVSIASVNTNQIRLNLTVGAGVNGLAMTPDPNAVIVPYLIDAVNDTATAVTISTAGGTPIANVLANDTLGGIRATLSNVTLSQVSSTGSGVRLDTSTGAVVVDPGASAGAHAVVYRICETASPSNCDQATASLTVRDPYIINAVDDSATTNTGKIAVNVLTNDTLNALPATTGTVRVTQLTSTHSGVVVSASGAVTVASGTPMGAQSLTYRICEIASPTNCDDATVSLNVIPYIVDAVNDAGTTTRGGGTAVANVLANDKFGTGPATLSNVRLTLVSSTSTGVVLNLATGAVTVASGTAQGSHSLVYRICEVASPANCDQATVAVTVNPYLIDAVNDSGRGSSKYANTPIASVLANDTLGGARATTANVSLSLVSISPANSQIRLDLTDGSVDVLGKTESSTYTLVYRICEIGNPTNCDQAMVSLYLSGGD